MKHLSIFLVSTAALISVKAKIPDYVHTCNRYDPDLGPCIEQSIKGMRPRLAIGIPDLGVPPIDPLHIDHVTFDLGSGFKMSIEDMELSGLKDFDIQNVTANVDTHTYTFDIIIPEVTVKGTYDVDATLASIPLKGNGPVTLTTKWVTGRGTLYGKTVEKDKKTFYFFYKMEFHMNIKDYLLQLEKLFPGDPSIGEATNKVLNEEKDEVLRVLLPGLEKAVVEKILAIATQICKHFTWDELFPTS